MYNPFQQQNMQQQMGMQPNQSMDPRAPMMQQPQAGQQAMGGAPPWAQQMGQGPNQPPMPPPQMGAPPQMGNGMAAMAPGPGNPIDKQATGMMNSEGMGGAANSNPYGQAAMMGLQMLSESEDGANEVIQRRQQMNQQGLDRMQQLAAIMRQKMA